MRKGALALVLLAAGPALAYLLPAAPLLRRCAERRSHTKAFALVVQGTMTLYGASAQAAGTSEGAPVPAVLRFNGPQTARLELALPGGTAGHARKPGSKPEDIGPAIPAARILAAEVVEVLAARRSNDTLAPFLAERGVDLEAVSLGRQGGRVAYVIGAAAFDKPERAQVWLDKDSFQPLRFQFGAGSDLVDLTFAIYGKAPLFEQWPRTIEVRRGGALEARFVAESAEAATEG